MACMYYIYWRIYLRKLKLEHFLPPTYSDGKWRRWGDNRGYALRTIAA